MTDEEILHRIVDALVPLVVPPAFQGMARQQAIQRIKGMDAGEAVRRLRAILRP